MIVGVPKEIKTHEYRVALLPVGARLLAEDGHQVLVQRGAGAGSGFTDADYEAAGATLVDGPEPIFERAELLIKVKEPQPAEIEALRSDQVVFTYFHFAASRELTQGCLGAGITAVAYETLEDAHGRLPLLIPMSEVAGKLAIQEGAKYLERPMGGRGVLLGGVPGVGPADVLVLGGGVVGACAARMAAGLGANVVITDINLDRLRYLDEVMPPNVSLLFSDPHAVDEQLRRADLVVGAVLIHGARAPRLVSRAQLGHMKRGAVVVDVGIDQGGCFETSRPTAHDDPVYEVDGVLHYCVANMPGAVSRTSSQALCNATLPYARDLAAKGVDGFVALSAGHGAAVNMRAGKLTHPAVGQAFPDLPSA